MRSDDCFNCVYSFSVNNMQACVWDTGLVSRRTKCNKYKRSWQKTLSPILYFIMGFLVGRMIILIFGGI